MPTVAACHAGVKRRREQPPAGSFSCVRLTRGLARGLPGLEVTSPYVL